jgi:hypothetical protein
MTADAATAAPPTSAARRVTSEPVRFSSKHFSVHIALLPSLGPTTGEYFIGHRAATQLAARIRQPGPDALERDGHVSPELLG